MNPRQRRGLLLLVLCRARPARRLRPRRELRLGRRTEVDPKITRARAHRSRVEGQRGDHRRHGGRRSTMPKRWAPDAALPTAPSSSASSPAPTCARNSILQEGMLVAPPELSPGEREVAILVDASTGVAGKIEPGRPVDIIAAFQGDPTAADEARTARSSSCRARACIDVGQPQLKGGGGVAARPSRTRRRSSRSRSRSAKEQELRVPYARVVRRTTSGSRCCAPATAPSARCRDDLQGRATRRSGRRRDDQ